VHRAAEIAVMAPLGTVSIIALVRHNRKLALARKSGDAADAA
jgi:hypothetical protein